MILDISSDEEQGSSAETKSSDQNLDWLSALFGNLNSDDDTEADDDVVVVREVVNENHHKSRKSMVVMKDVDDDCVVLDCDPNNPVAEVNDDKDNSGSDDLLIVAEKGQVNLFVYLFIYFYKLFTIMIILDLWVCLYFLRI